MEDSNNNSGGKGQGNSEDSDPEEFDDGTLPNLFNEALGMGAANRKAFIEKQIGIHQERGLILQRLVAAAGQESPDTYSFLGERYTVQDVLGQGGQGIVLAAEDRDLNRPVAIKILAPGSPLQKSLELSRKNEFSGGSSLEAQISERLKHQAIVPIYDVGRTSNHLDFFTMRLVADATDLSAWFSERDSDRSRYKELGSSVGFICGALEAAHLQQILHLDLKPSNVLVAGDKSIYLMDWGISAVGGGSPRYMSPEQAELGKVDCDPRTDVFGVGALLYSVLAERPPYPNKTSKDGLLQLAKEAKPTPLRNIAPETPKDLCQIVQRAMHVDPEQRYASIGELSTDLEAFVEGRPLPSSKPPVWKRTLAWARRKKGSASLVVGGAILVAITLWLWGQNYWLSSEVVAETRNSFRAAVLGTGQALGEPNEYEALENLQELIESQGQVAYQVSQWETEQLLLRRSESVSDYAESKIQSVQSLSEGRFILGSVGGEVLIHTPFESPTLLATVEFPADLLSLSADDKQIIVVSKTGEIAALAFPSGKTVWERSVQEGSQITSLAVHASGRICLGLSDGRCLFLRQDESPAVWCDLLLPRLPVANVEFLNRSEGDSDLALVSGGRIYVFDEDGMIHSQGRIGGDLNRKRLVETFADFDNQGFVCADQSGSVRAWNWSKEANWEQAWEYPLMGGTPTKVKRFESGITAVALLSGAILFLDHTGQLIQREHLMGQSVKNFSLSLSEKVLVASGAEGGVFQIQLDSKRASMVLAGHKTSVSTASFDPSGTRLVTGSADQTLRIWNAASGECLHTLRGHTDRIRAVCWSGDGKWIASAGSDSTVRFWDADTGVLFGERKVRKLFEVWEFSWSPTLGFIALCRYTATGASFLGAYSPSNPNCTVLWESNDIRGFEFDPNTNSIVALAHNGTATRILAEKGATSIGSYASLPPGEDAVYAASAGLEGGGWVVAGNSVLRKFSSRGVMLAEVELVLPVASMIAGEGGTRIFCGREDGHVDVRDGDSLERLLSFPSHREVVLSLAYSAEKRLLATTSTNLKAKLWASQSDSFDLKRAHEVGEFVFELWPTVQQALGKSPIVSEALEIVKELSSSALGQGERVQAEMLDRLVKTEGEDFMDMIDFAYGILSNESVSDADLVLARRVVGKIQEQTESSYKLNLRLVEALLGGTHIRAGEVGAGIEVLSRLWMDPKAPFDYIQVITGTFLIEAYSEGSESVKLQAAKDKMIEGLKQGPVSEDSPVWKNAQRALKKEQKQ